MAFDAEEFHKKKLARSSEPTKIIFKQIQNLYI